jgi:hypothetical protein
MGVFSVSLPVRAVSEVYNTPCYELPKHGNQCLNHALTQWVNQILGKPKGIQI